MATATSDDLLVPLPDGRCVPASVVGWLVDAEIRGITIRRQPNGMLFAGPREAVHPEDLIYIKANRDAVLTIVSYLDAVAPC